MLTPTDTHDWRPHDGNSGIGQPVRRKEDLRLVTGQGCFSDDVDLPGQAYAVMVRSPHAHARIRSIDVAPALAVPGVVAVLTGRDLLADRVKPIPHKQWSYHPAEIPLQNKDGAAVFAAAHFPMPADKARFVGEAVAMVIADTVAAAKDGAERVAIDYQPLPAVTQAVASAALDAPRLWEEAPSNVLIDAEVGNAAATAAAFARAAHVVRLETWIPRVTAVPMEPRAAVASYDAATQRYTVYAGSGGAVRLKTDIAQTLDIPDAAVRVVMRDVGGNFGSRGAIYPEFVLVAWASRRVGRPVKWTCERHESFLSDYQGRDLASEAELALDADGKFLALRGSNVGNLGALTGEFLDGAEGRRDQFQHLPHAGRLLPRALRRQQHHADAALPELRPAGGDVRDGAADRPGGAPMRARPGRDQAAQSAHRVRAAVHEPVRHGLRQRRLPSGDGSGAGIVRLARFRRPPRRGEKARQGSRDRARQLHRHRDRRSARARRGHGTAGRLRRRGDRHRLQRPGARDELRPAGDRMARRSVRARAAAHRRYRHGPGRRRDAFRPRHAARQHHHPQGDARHHRQGRPHRRPCAARRRQAEIEFADGRFAWKGTNRSLDLFEVAGAARERRDLPDELRGALAETCDETVNVAGYGYGSHVCEVEIDPETGVVEIVRHTTVDDVGRAVNPLIIHGQTHGGIAQGVGEALLEQCFYDAGTGQPLAGSFMDYAMPRASDFPSFTTDISEVPSTTHPLGIRPAGEGGTTPALAVVVNAIVDALAGFGVTHIEMPATPERIWRAINGMEPRSRTRP